MASCSSKPDRRHFLSIIGGDAIHLQKLEIPRQFVRFHGDNLSRVVMLKVPTGARWPVEIVRRNGQIWFQKGWREFAKYYSLVEGSSLIFEYEKIRASSQFNVIIYDKNMMEIRYSISFDHGDFSDSDDEEQVFGENVVVDEAESDSSLQILGSKSNLDGQAQEQRVNQSFTRKKASTKAEKAKAVYIQSEEIDYPFHLQEEEDSDQEPNVGEENSDMDVWPISSEDESPMPSSSRPRKDKRKKKQENNRTRSEGFTFAAKRDNCDKSLTGRKAKAVIRTAISYKSDNPSFSIAINPSSCGKKATVPSNFADKYFKKPQGNIILESEGNTCSVGYISCASHQRYRHTKLSGGWSKFVKANNLEVGDVCAFEMMNQNESKFKVVIFKENQVAAIGDSKRSKHKDMSSLKDFTSVNPYFQLKLSKKLVLESNVISIPASFIKKCKNRSIKEAILQVENQVFHVKLLSYPQYNQFKLTGGVPEFVHGNCLREGDVCVFELIDSETMLIKVSIFRNT